MLLLDVNRVLSNDELMAAGGAGADVAGVIQEPAGVDGAAEAD